MFTKNFQVGPPFHAHDDSNFSELQARLAVQHAGATAKAQPTFKRPRHATESESSTDPTIVIDDDLPRYESI